MRILILLTIILFTLTSVSFASFPITENTNYEVLNASSAPDILGDDDDLSIFNIIIRGILFSWLMFSFVLLIRAWWRAWRDRVKWVRILTYIVLGFFASLIVLAILSDGLVYNMQ